LVRARSTVLPDCTKRHHHGLAIGCKHPVGISVRYTTRFLLGALGKKTKREKLNLDGVKVFVVQGEIANVVALKLLLDLTEVRRLVNSSSAVFTTRSDASSISRGETAANNSFQVVENVPLYVVSERYCPGR
jgi:hypothetical protein